MKTCVAVLASLGIAGCNLLAPAPAVPPPQPESSAEPMPAPELSSTLPMIIQARLHAVVKGVPQDSWIDFEVNGPAKHALAACNALVAKETSLNLPPEVRFEVARPCSHEALAEPPATTAFALVRVVRHDPVELSLAISNDIVPADAMSQLRVRRRELSGYEDEASCVAMRDRLEAGRLRAEKEAQGKATEWLDATIAKQRSEAEAACKRPDPEECRKVRDLIGILEKRRAQQPQEPANRAPEAVCRKR